MKHILLVSLIIFSFSVISQDYLIVKGTIRDSLNHNPIENVVVTSEMGGERTVSNIKGEYKLKLPKWSGLEITFYHPSYKEFYFYLPPDSKYKEVIILDLNLMMKSHKINSVNLTYNKKKPDTMFASKVFNISDFEFYGDDKYIFLTYEKRLEKQSEIVYARKDQSIIDRFIVPEEALELRRDFMGYVNLYCEYNIYRITIENEKFKLYKLPKEDFKLMIEPVVDSIKCDYYYSNYRWDIPEFNYYVYDRVDSTNHKIKTVVNNETAEQYYYEYYYLTNKERVYAMKMEARTGISRHVIANQISGYTSTLLYRPAYAPMFKHQDTMLVFDHYANQIFKFGENDTTPCSVIDIDYHLVKDWKTWKRELVQDESQTQYVYALFLIDTRYFLKKINTYDGKIESITKLTHKYVENIMIRDNYVYYTYKPFDTMQKKFLYREQLN